MMRGQPSISPIYRQGQPVTVADDIEAWGRIERLRRAAWREAGVISVTVKELPDGLRSQMEAWAVENYGPR